VWAATNHYRVHRRLAVAPVMFRAISRPHLRPTSLPLLQPDEKPRMNWIKLSGFATAMAAALIAAPATARADCGDPGQDPCTGPVPTTDQVVAIMAELTDPNNPAASKTDIAALIGVAAPAAVVTAASASASYLTDDPAPPTPLPLPVGSQGVPPGVEVYCPGLPWIHDCHQCLGDPAHRCWDR
jgi:hypothetical protein